jgi:CheY-like chemotaxis protein
MPRSDGTSAMKRILVIDDSDLMRMVIKVSLERTAGWQVLTAASADEGLAAAAAEHPDAILLDVEMPGMDGTAAYRELQAAPDTRPIPVIMVTAAEQAAPTASGWLTWAWRPSSASRSTRPASPVGSRPRWDGAGDRV